MARKQDIDDLLARWPYEPNALAVRKIRGRDGRPLLQMRVDMGLLQLECEGRPDGMRPFGAPTYFDHLATRKTTDGGEFVLDEDECAEVDREFVQFYHRRICWLRLQEYGRAVQDADHTLGLMDICRRHSPDEEWTMAHEQYRPFVLFHRSQAAALAAVQESEFEKAIDELNDGLSRIERLYEEYEVEEEFEDDELVKRLVEMRDALRNEFHIERTLHEQLADAVSVEDYELAARLRDQLARRNERDDVGPPPVKKSRRKR